MDECAGGAMDVNAFRDNIEYGQRPDVSTLTYEGLFAEYYFDTKTNKKNKDNDDEKKENETEHLINPTYCYAKSKKPPALIKSLKLLNPKNISTTDDIKQDNNAVIIEYFMSVGLNETFDVNKLKRNKLNLLIVLDHSGSMGSSFSYHDKDNMTKMEVANKAVISLLSQLNDDDRLGIIRFDSTPTVVEKLSFIKDINIEELKEKVLKIKEEGGTNMETAYKAATDMYTEIFSTFSTAKDKIAKPIDKYSNRIIFLTDAMPNAGATDPNSLLGMMENNAGAADAQYPIFTTFIGIGLDFNASLIDQITKVNGANYYSVHSNEEFMKKMDEEFIFMVTPLLFNFVFTLLAEGNSCCIEAAYGTGDDEKAVSQNGEVMNVSTLFPSAHDNDDQVKGGVVLLKLKTDYNDMEVNVTYQDVEGKHFKIDDMIMFGGENKDSMEGNDVDVDYFDNSGIRKSILLVRYVILLKQWMQYEDKKNNTSDVSEEYKKVFIEFKEYFELEIKQIGDDTLKKELEILDKLIEWKNMKSKNDQNEEDGAVIGGASDVQTQNVEKTKKKSKDSCLIM